MSKQNAVCTECKSDRIVLDAWAVWDIEHQWWELDEMHGEAFCRDCGNNEFELIDIEEED